MQVSLADLIEEFTAALSVPHGLASAEGIFISNDDKLGYRSCAALIGINSELFIDHKNGATSIDPLQAQYIRRQLIEAKHALQTLPDVELGHKPYLIDEFAAGTLAALGEADNYPQLKQFLNGTHMMAVTKATSNRYETLTTTLSTRSEAVAAIDLIRPDIGLALRKGAEKAAINMEMPGSLPATPKQIRDLQHSYQIVTDTFAQKDATAAQAALEKIRTETRPKPIIVTAQAEGKLISRELPGGKRAVVLSTRPREESTEHFMVELDNMQTMLDLCKGLSEKRKHANGEVAKYYPTHGENGEFWLRSSDKESAEYQRKILRTLLQDGEMIRVEADRSQSRKHPTYWVNIPHDLVDKILDESTLLHALRDEVRSTFDRCIQEEDPKLKAALLEEAQTLKKDLLIYVKPRIYVGKHAAAVTEDRASEAGNVKTK